MVVDVQEGRLLRLLAEDEEHRLDELNRSKNEIVPVQDEDGDELLVVLGKVIVRSALPGLGDDVIVVLGGGNV
jgi:hypothetical protein